VGQHTRPPCGMVTAGGGEAGGVVELWYAMERHCSSHGAGAGPLRVMHEADRRRRGSDRLPQGCGLHGRSPRPARCAAGTRVEKRLARWLAAAVVAAAWCAAADEQAWSGVPQGWGWGASLQAAAVGNGARLVAALALAGVAG
jgi:hypothetical protein